MKELPPLYTATPRSQPMSFGDSPAGLYISPQDAAKIKAQLLGTFPKLAEFFQTVDDARTTRLKEFASCHLGYQPAWEDELAEDEGCA